MLLEGERSSSWRRAAVRPQVQAALSEDEQAAAPQNPEQATRKNRPNSKTTDKQIKGQSVGWRIKGPPLPPQPGRTLEDMGQWKKRSQQTPKVQWTCRSSINKLLGRKASYQQCCRCLWEGCEQTQPQVDSVGMVLCHRPCSHPAGTVDDPWLRS